MENRALVPVDRVAKSTTKSEYAEYVAECVEGDNLRKVQPLNDGYP